MNNLFVKGSPPSLAYVPRRLHTGDAQRHEDRLPLDSDVVTVILAEPGAGKTRFLDALAMRHGTRPMQASIARHRKLDSDKTSHNIESAAALQRRILASLDPRSVGRLDVVVLDIERTSGPKRGDSSVLL